MSYVIRKRDTSGSSSHGEKAADSLAHGDDTALDRLRNAAQREEYRQWLADRLPSLHTARGRLAATGGR